jgi:flagellar biosynthesis anti-sigma factor FlgM
MRIDLYNTAASQIANEQSSQKIASENAAKSSPSSVSGTEDHTTLTSDSASVGSLVSTALNSPEVRQSLVDSLKASVNSGQYELNPGKIAASMVDDHA